MKIKIYTDREKTNAIYEMELNDYLIMVNNELIKDHWQVIQYGDIEIRRESEE